MSAFRPIHRDTSIIVCFSKTAGLQVSKLQIRIVEILRCAAGSSPAGAGARTGTRAGAGTVGAGAVRTAAGNR